MANLSLRSLILVGEVRRILLVTSLRSLIFEGMMKSHPESASLS